VEGKCAGSCRYEQLEKGRVRWSRIERTGRGGVVVRSKCAAGWCWRRRDNAVAGDGGKGKKK